MIERSSIRTESRGSTRGSVLVEFALICFALYLIVAAVLELGRAVFAAQAIQTAADTMARELATAPLKATDTFQDALYSSYIRTRVFDDRALVISLDQYPPGPALEAHFASLPIVNQMLRPVMISDEIPGGGPVLRYPGALLLANDPNGGSYYTVRIPRVVARSAEGIETITWAGVVEEVLPAHSPVSHFGIDAPLKAFRGLASVRVNYPYQASTLTAYRNTGNVGGTVNQPILAKDGAVNDLGFAPDDPLSYSFVEGGDPELGDAYAGKYGLGRQYIMVGESVRPWRKLLSAQAVRRREVYL
jgi:hypothetical protein